MSKELSDLKVLVQHMQKLGALAAEAEADYKAKKAEYEFFRDDIIPEFLVSLGLQEVTLDTGETVMLATKYFGNISEARSKLAHQWLRQNGEGALIKTAVNMAFGPSQEDQVDLKVLKQYLGDLSIDYQEKEAVHSQTLKAFIKRMMEEGKNFPYDLFGVYVATETHVEK